MEPNKLEKQIREKISAREINPSAASWDRLDAMLSVAEKKKPKRNFKWFFIAAGIVGFVFVGMFLLNQNNTNSEINNNTVVKSNVDVNAVKERGNTIFQTNEPIKSIKNQTGIKSTEIAEVSTSKRTSTTIKNKQNKSTESIKSEIHNQENIAEVIPQKVEENPKEISNPSTLLATSDSNTPEKTSLNKPKLKINANALLSQVDGEIELTFRQKTIKMISKKFESAKEAVASRNQE